MTERRAESATREAIQWLKCEFMSHKIGENLFGVVSSVTEFGLFVELEEFYVDGLIHITSLGQDYYRYNTELRQLVGEKSGRVYKTGDRLEVKVARVDMDQGRIDFALTEMVNQRFGGSKRGHKKTNPKPSKKEPNKLSKKLSRKKSGTKKSDKGRKKRKNKHRN